MSMLQRTVSLWQRLRSWPRRTGQEQGKPGARKERRVWLRSPCTAPATVQAARAANETRFPAKVCDVSRGGIKLVVSRRFASGDLLSVELPGAEWQSSTTVLALVVHVHALDGDEWALGCSFASELSDDDLRALGGQRIRPLAPDQRAWMRFPGNAKASFRLVTTAEQPLWPARVLNISANGVALSVAQCVEAGALLNIELQGASEESARVMLACVVRVDALSAGGWVYGCNFIRELTEEELQALL